MKVRRIAAKAAIATVGLLAVAGLSACRVESGAALFVQDERVSEERVDEIVASAPADLNDGEKIFEHGDRRQLVVSWLTQVELAERIAADRGTPLPGPNYAETASSLGGDTAFTRLYAEYQAYSPILFSGATPADPASTDIPDLVTEIETQAGGELPGLDAALSDGMSQPTNLDTLGRRAYLNALFTEYDVLVNPRYGDVTVAAGTLQLPVNGSFASVDINVPIPSTTS